MRVVCRDLAQQRLSSAHGAKGHQVVSEDLVHILLAIRTHVRRLNLLNKSARNVITKRKRIAGNILHHAGRIVGQYEIGLAVGVEKAAPECGQGRLTIPWVERLAHGAVIYVKRRTGNGKRQAHYGPHETPEMPGRARLFASHGFASRARFPCRLWLRRRPVFRLFRKPAAKNQPVAAAGNFKEERLVDAG